MDDEAISRQDDLPEVEEGRRKKGKDVGWAALPLPLLFLTHLLAASPYPLLIFTMFSRLITSLRLA